MRKKLEKLMYMGLGALIAFGGYLFGALHSDNVDAQLAPADVKYNEIRCRSLAVVDADGNTLLTLGSNLGGGDVSIYEENGELRARLGIQQNRYSDGEPISDGLISIHGESEKILASLESTGLGGAVQLMDENGRDRVLLGVDFQSGGYVSVKHGRLEENNSATLSAGPRGGIVDIWRNDKKMVNLDVDDYGSRIAIFNKNGENVLQTSVNNAGDGVIFTWDQFGDVTGGFPEGKKVKINKRLR